MARQLVQDFGEGVRVTYHDLARPDSKIPDDVARRVAEEHLPYPVSVIDGEIVSAGEVSYFLLGDRVKQALAPTAPQG